MLRFIALLLVAHATLAGAPTLEIYDCAPPKDGRPLLLVLKLSNPDERDYFAWAESITAIPLHARFRDRGGECDLVSQRPGAVHRSQRLRAGSYVLIDTDVLGEVLADADGDVSFRCELFADRACREPVVTQELRVSLKDLPPPDSAAAANPPAGEPRR